LWILLQVQSPFICSPGFPYLECQYLCHVKCLPSIPADCGRHVENKEKSKGFGNSKEPESSKLFGMELEAILQEGETIPRLVQSCVNAIEERGLDVEGIYRLSGVTSQNRSLRKTFESGRFLPSPMFTPPSATKRSSDD